MFLIEKPRTKGNRYELLVALYFIPQSVRTPIGKEDVVGELFGTVRHKHWVGSIP
jgi:hypothetical protein